MKAHRIADMLDLDGRSRRAARAVVIGSCLLAVSCSLTLGVLCWDAWNVAQNSLEDALRVLTDPASDAGDRAGARFVIDAHVQGIINALRTTEADPQSAQLLQNIHDRTR